MAGANNPDCWAQSTAEEIISAVAMQEYKVHAPFSKFMQQSDSVKVDIVFAIDGPSGTELIDGVPQQLQLVAGVPFRDSNSIQTVPLLGCVWTSEQEELVARSILENPSYFHALSPNSDKLSLKGSDQNSATRYFVNNVADNLVKSLLDACYQKIGANKDKLNIRMHINLVTHKQKLAHGWHHDPIANTTRFVLVREVMWSAIQANTFKEAVFAAQDQVPQTLSLSSINFFWS